MPEFKTRQDIKYNWPEKFIMIVEDENVNYRFLEVCLRNTNAKIIRALDGKQAVKLFSENQDIDLILMDIKLPEMDGYEATREIRKINKTVPIIAQTAFGMTGDREKVLEAGCNDYIAKPFVAFDLLFLIDRYFQ